MKTKNKKTTVDELAVMTKNGFDELEGRISQRFEKVDERFDNLEADIAIMKVDITDVKTDIRRIDERTEKTYDLLDKYLKAQEDFKEEFEVMKHQAKRVGEVIKSQLGVSID